MADNSTVGWKGTRQQAGILLLVSHPGQINRDINGWPLEY